MYVHSDFEFQDNFDSKKSITHISHNSSDDFKNYFDLGVVFCYSQFINNSNNIQYLQNCLIFTFTWADLVKFNKSFFSIIK